jgi:hypothetical protein
MHAHHRPQPVGADHADAEMLLSGAVAIGEGRDAARMGGKLDNVGTELKHDVHVLAREAMQRLVQVRAQGQQPRISIAAGGGVDRRAGEQAARFAASHNQLVRLDCLFAHTIERANGFQRRGRVRGELDTCADFLNSGRALDHNRAEARAREHIGGGKAADSCARDEDGAGACHRSGDQAALPVSAHSAGFAPEAGSLGSCL